MMHGKRELPRSKRGLTALVALALILCCAVGGTVAWLATATGPVTNTFTPAKVETEIEEKTDDGVKENVRIHNKGDIPVYVRAAIIVNWVDKDGNIYPQKPEKVTDYTIEIGDKWEESNGFYYYESVVGVKNPQNPDATGVTEALIVRCVPVKDNAPDGYYLQVTILAEAIQADGMGATSAQDAFAKAKTN